MADLNQQAPQQSDLPTLLQTLVLELHPKPGMHEQVKELCDALMTATVKPHGFAVTGYGRAPDPNTIVLHLIFDAAQSDGLTVTPAPNATYAAFRAKVAPLVVRDRASLELVAELRGLRRVH